MIKEKETHRAESIAEAPDATATAYEALRIAGSYEAVVKATGISRGTLLRWIKKSCNPHLATLLRLADWVKKNKDRDTW